MFVCFHDGHAVAWKSLEVEGPYTDKKRQKYMIWASLHIYAPLAQKAGLKDIQYLFEDKAFQYLYPMEHRRVTEMLKSRAKDDEDVLEQACKLVKQVRRRVKQSAYTPGLLAS